MAQTYTAPLQIAPDAASNMALNLEQMLQCPAPINGDAQKALACEIDVKIGVFFDGTSNNRDRDMPTRAHSNVARLFNAHKTVDGDGALMQKDIYSIYVAGVGTKFEPNGEYTELAEGKSQGAGGQERVLFALVRTLSTIYRAFHENVELYPIANIASILQKFKSEVGANTPFSDQPRPSRDQWLQDFTRTVSKEIEAARTAKKLPAIPLISISVFGFSRGSTEAVAFCHWLDAALGGRGAIAGMQLEINFVGLFDTVSSVGIADSASRAAGLPLHGFSGWAEETRKALPAIVKKVVHMVAAHEQRMNFPLTRIKANTDLQEYVYPGMHSDVGGGYGPDYQGRSPSDAELISQIPLLHMHRHARAAGVPLLDHSLMSRVLAQDYALNPALANSWNMYMTALDSDYRAQHADTSIAQCHDLHALVKAHMRLYYHFRRNHLAVGYDTFRYLPGYPNGLTMSPQENSLLQSYQSRLVGDIQRLCPQDALTQVKDKQDGNFVLANQIRNSQAGRGNRYPPPPPAPLPDQEWVDFAKGILGGQLPLEQRVQGDTHFLLLGRYVHDSLAGFVLRGPLTNEDKAHWVVEIVAKHGRGEGLNGTEQEVYERYARRAETDGRLVSLIEQRVGVRKKFPTNQSAKEEQDQWTAYYEQWAFEDQDAAHVANDPSIVDRTKAERSITPTITQSNRGDFKATCIETAAVYVIAGDSLQEGGGYFLPRNIFE